MGLIYTTLKPQTVPARNLCTHVCAVNAFVSHTTLFIALPYMNYLAGPAKDIYLSLVTLVLVLCPGKHHYIYPQALYSLCNNDSLGIFFFILFVMKLLQQDREMHWLSIIKRQR